MNQPARLHKKVDDVSPVNKLFDMIEAWVQTHALLCLFVLFAFLISLFVVLVYAIIGVSATDSGVVYNQFNNIV